MSLFRQEMMGSWFMSSSDIRWWELVRLWGIYYTAKTEEEVNFGKRSVCLMYFLNVPGSMPVLLTKIIRVKGDCFKIIIPTRGSLSSIVDKQFSLQLFIRMGLTYCQWGKYFKGYCSLAPPGSDHPPLLTFTMSYSSHCQIFGSRNLSPS